MSILILGLGNILMSDEGIGVRVVEHLEANYRFPEGIDLLDGGTCGMELLDVMAGRDHLIIVDAIKTDETPGEVLVIEHKDVPAFFSARLTPHQVGISDVLAALKIVDEYPKDITIYGTSPESLEVGMEMTPAVAACLPKLVDTVLGHLRESGYDITPLKGAA